MNRFDWYKFLVILKSPNIEEVRILFDTIPFQKPDRNRIKDVEE